MLHIGQIQTGFQIRFNYQVTLSGDYLMLCDFLGSRQQTITSTLENGDYLSFDTSALNENYSYQCTILDPNGRLISFTNTGEEENHTQLSFTTRIGYYQISGSGAEGNLSNIVIGTPSGQGATTLPVEWLSLLQLESDVWTISYNNQIRNQNVELFAVYDENGNDITNLVNQYQITEGAKMIDLIFSEPVQGRIKLISQSND